MTTPVSNQAPPTASVSADRIDQGAGGGKLRVDVLRDKDDFEKIGGQWNDLLDRCANRDVLYSHQWYKYWIRHFLTTGEILVLLIREADRIRVALPLIQAKYRKKGISFEVVKSMTNSHSMRFDFLADDPSPELLGRLLRNAFDVTGRRTLVLESVPEDALLLRYLSDASRAEGFRYVVKKENQNYLVRIGKSFDVYYGALSSKFRKNVKAAERKALDRAPLEMLLPASSEEVLEYLNRGFDVELQSWKGEAGSALKQRQNVVDFYAGLARELYDSGHLTLALLSNGDDDIAFMYIVGNYGTLRALKIGVNDRFRNIGPGMLLTKRMLERAFHNGDCSLWDFCGGPGRWKRDWSNETENFYRVFLFKGDVVGKSIHVLAKGYAASHDDTKSVPLETLQCVHNRRVVDKEDLSSFTGCQLQTLVQGMSGLNRGDRAWLWTLRASSAVGRRMKKTLHIRGGDVVKPKETSKSALSSLLGDKDRLEAGDTVRVLPMNKIRETLDKNGRTQGMDFLAGMERYCGKKTKVLKRVNYVFDERAWKMRKCKNVVILENVICDGRGMFGGEGCDRCCYYFWKEAWLEKC